VMTAAHRIPLAAIVLAAASLLATPLGAPADQLRYDPDTCPTEAQGKVYLRFATGVAFGFPARALQFLYGSFEPKPEAPDPSAPEGCPGNPIITHWATVGFSFEVPPAADGGEPRRIATFVKLSGATARSFDRRTGMLRLQSIVFGLAESGRRFGRCEEAPEGWEVCYQPKKDRPHHTDNGAYYIALANRHPLRSGISLAVGCGPPAPWNRARLCQLNYRPMPLVHLALNFTDQEIPIEDIFAFDDAVVAWLERSRMPELDFAPPPGVLPKEEL